MDEHPPETKQTMIERRLKNSFLLGLVACLMLSLPRTARAQDVAPTAQENGETSQSLLDLIQAGGVMGYLLILVSIVAAALIIDAFRITSRERLNPEGLSGQLTTLAKAGRLRELKTLAQSSDSALGRTLDEGLAQGDLGIEAVRLGMEDAGSREILRVRQRTGYLGFIGATAPMLGLLGTVLGMIDSFGVLGQSRSSADPAELAVGISEALITTSLGLVIAVPVLLFSTVFRNRISVAAQDLGAHCDRLIIAIESVRRPGAQRPDAPSPTAEV